MNAGSPLRAKLITVDLFSRYYNFRLYGQEPLRLHITTHWCTAPNHIHIVFRVANMDSATLSRHGKIIPSLIESP